jgi:uncharacterized protein YukE
VPGRIIEVRYRELENTASIFEQHRDISKKLQEQLLACETPLKQGSWIASAADDFYRDLNRDLYPALDRLMKALDHAGTTTLKIAQIYRLAEQQACDFIPQSSGGIMDRFWAVYNENIHEEAPLSKSVYETITQSGKLFAQIEKVSPNATTKILGKLDIPESLTEAIKDSPQGQQLGARLEQMLKKVGGDDLAARLLDSKRATKLGGGLVGGALDFVVGGKYTAEEGAVQLGSGLAQGAIGMTGVGEVVLVADAGIQLLGGAFAKGMSNHANQFATPGTSAEEIRSTAGKLEEGLKAMSLDNRIDGIARAVYQLDVEKGFDELGTFVVGGWQTLTQGGKLGYQAIGGTLHHLLD